ncbi:PUM1 [Symbiodinium natans]|uniref:PUM1 protein n=1 Tax=Symbiodinium natans TaxID=878477 RepID=A0A812R130_9DINO|nr:PUM1 [Symbiodinium natans]
MMQPVVAGFVGFAVAPGWPAWPKPPVFAAYSSGASSTTASTANTPPASPTAVRLEVLRKANESAGCRELQKLLQFGTWEEQEEILSQLVGNVADVAQSPHGNFVLQHAIRVLSSERLVFVSQELRSWRSPKEIAKHKYACRVLERMIEFFPLEHTFYFMKEIVRHTVELSSHAIGNYSVQHCMEYGNVSCRREIATVVLNHIHEFAVDPYGCGVLNKALIHAPQWEQLLMASALAGDDRVFRQMAAMQKGFAATQSLFQVAQLYPFLNKRVRYLLQKNLDISQTKHGQALLHTLLPELGAIRATGANWQSSEKPQKSKQKKHGNHAKCGNNRSNRQQGYNGYNRGWNH